MKRITFFILIEMACVVGFSKNPRWEMIEKVPIPAHTNLNVHWDVSIKLPHKVWIYQLVPRRFSSKTISSVMTMCSFAEKDKIQQDINSITFKSPDGLRILSISSSLGSISYDIPKPHYSPTHLAEDVPKMSEMPELTSNFLRIVGIELSEIKKNTNGLPNFGFWEPFTEYYLKGGGSITNIAFRAVVFCREVDGAEVIGKAGHCGLEFGEHGKIIQIHLSWPKLKRHKSFPTLKPQAIIQLLREGKCLQEPVPTNVGDIDWPSVKSVTVKKAEPCYFAGDTSWLYPFLWLDTMVDTGHGIVEVGIDCPIFDESKN
jgi:hypothetical protein